MENPIKHIPDSDIAAMRKADLFRATSRLFRNRQNGCHYHLRAHAPVKTP